MFSQAVIFFLAAVTFLSSANAHYRGPSLCGVGLGLGTKKTKGSKVRAKIEQKGKVRGKGKKLKDNT